MGGAITGTMWYSAAILVLATARSAFPTDPEDGETRTYDVKQYEFAKAVSGIGTSRGPTGVAGQVYDEWIGPNTVTFKDVSQETMVKICMDLDVKIMVENENKLIDCKAIKSFFIPVGANNEFNNYVSDRLRRDAIIDGTEGSGGTPLEDSIITNNNNTSSPNVTATTIKTQLNGTEQKNDTKTSEVSHIKDIKNVVINDKTNLTWQANESDKNITSLTSQNITNQNNTSLPTSTVNTTQLMKNHTINAQTHNVTQQLMTNPNVTLPTSVNATGKEGPDTHANHTTANITKIKESGTNVTGTNIIEGPVQNKTQVHRKGKHMDLGNLIPQVQDVNSTRNLTTEVGGSDKMNLRTGNPTNSTQAGTPKTDSSTKQSTGSSTIIWFLFGGVVIAGAVLVGYKYMKKRNARQAEPVPKRNSANPVASARPNAPREQEMRPLMDDTDKSNNVKSNAGDTNNTSETRDHGQNKGDENGTGDHLNKVETTNETTRESSQNPEE